MANLYDQEPDGLSGINAVAEREIFPRLREMGDKPAREMKKQKYKYFGVAVLISLGGGLLFGGVEGILVISPFFLPFMLLGAYVLYRLSRGQTGELGAELLEVVTTPIAKHAGLTISAEGGEEFAQECMRVGGSLPYDETFPRTYLQGSVNGKVARCCLLTMRDKREGPDGPDTKSFDGSLYAVGLDFATQGRVLLMPNLGALNFLNALSSKHSDAEGETFEKVEVGTPEFQKQFEVRATNADAAMTLLDPPMQERLSALIEGLGRAQKSVSSVAIADGKIYFAVADANSGRLLAKLNPKKPADDPEPVRAVADAMEEIIGRLRLMAG